LIGCSLDRNYNHDKETAVSTIAFVGYLFAQVHLDWFVIFYFISAIAMISDLRLKKI